MSTAGLARGARINRELFNNKLKSHKLVWLQGNNVDPQENEDVNTLLHILGLDPKAYVCAMFPYSSSGPLDAAGYLILSYEWNWVLHAKEVDEALPKKEIPAGFESAVKQIDPDAKHGVWCIAGAGDLGLMWNKSAETNIFTCGLDHQTFRTWAEFTAHNLADHDLTTEYLPYA